MVVINKPYGPVPACRGIVKQTEARDCRETYPNVPFQCKTVLAFKPPFFFLHQPRRLIIKYDVLEKTLDLRCEEREIRYTRCLDEIAFEASIAVGRELLRVDAYLQWNRSLPDQPAK